MAFEGVAVFSSGEENWDSANPINLRERKFKGTPKSHGQLARKKGGGRNFSTKR